MSAKLVLLDINFTDFESWLTSHVLTLSPTPTQMNLIRHDNENVSVAGWRINVRARIYETATADNVINGWNLILQFLHNYDVHPLLTFVFRSIILDYTMPSVINPKNGQARPLRLVIISLLRLAFWWEKCSKTPSFSVKQIELRTKWTEIIDLVERINTDSFEDDLERIRSKIEDVTSELMFSGLALDCNKQLSFTKTNELSIDDIPCEVKTIHDEIIIGRDESGYPLPMSIKEKFGTINLKDETSQQILRNKYRKDIMKAIDQGGLIVFIDSSLSTVAQDIVATDYNDDIDGRDRFKNFLSDAITMTKTEPMSLLPILIGAGAIGGSGREFIWYQTYYRLNAPVIRDSSGKYKLDESKYDKIHISNNLNVRDLTLRKYALSGELQNKE